ncbi:MAG: hypothetical protein HUN04_06355 [Desulfobacter sp.]|nr:MAG: hypothetical protein HUN04_06355 [Desulfobacter sp.]
MADEFTLFPGLKVIRAQSSPDGSHVAQVSFGQSLLPDVFEYYKTKLTENGYTIKHTMQERSIIAEKPNMNAVISLDTQKGETVGMLALDVKPPRPAASTPVPPVVSPKQKEPEGKMNMAGLLGGKTKYPAELAAIVDLYPGSSIMLSREKGKDVGVMMTAKGVPAADAVLFYKTEILQKGWALAFDEANEGGTVLGFTKESREVTAVIRDAGEALIITLDLKK